MADDPKAPLPPRLKRGVGAFRPRERRLTLMAAAVVGCWVVVSWVVQPLWDRVQELRLHLQTQSEKLAMLHQLLAQAPPTAEESSQVASSAAPQSIEEERGAFLSELEALSRANHLQLHLKPKPIRREGQISRFDVELEVEGSQQSLLAFLDALFDMRKLLSLERLRIASMPTKDNTLRAHLVIERLLLL